jgi:hypothetical protein
MHVIGATAAFLMLTMHSSTATAPHAPDHVLDACYDVAAPIAEATPCFEPAVHGDPHGRRHGRAFGHHGERRNVVGPAR